ncbi:phage tail protein [Mannheimia bovis]|uniref:Phage tail protein n=2 Tax=Mannheimia bovis TaxID=2770636 RepID=A0A7H1C5G4_9PAST|nr:phage tail protein [Mannheimia bovis]
MYQTYWYDENDLKVWTQKEFTWAISFTETPQIFTSVTTSVNYSHDCGVNVLSSSNNSKVLYHYYEHGNPNQGLCRIQFLGIGRWK